MQLTEYPRQFLGWNMKQARIGKYAIKGTFRKVELQEILLPHLATGILPRHGRKALRPLHAYSYVSAPGEFLEITPRPTAEIEDSEGRVPFDMAQQRINVLADVVIPRSLPKIFRMPVIVRQCQGYDLVQIVGQ